jgi:hypothetical protein
METKNGRTKNTKQTKVFLDKLFCQAQIQTMSKSKRVILLLTNILMLVASLVGFIGFIVLTDIHSHHGYAGYASRNDIINTTDVARLQTMGAVASDGWDRFTDVIDTNRWFFLGFGALLFVTSIIHFCLTPWKLKDES